MIKKMLLLCLMLTMIAASAQQKRLFNETAAQKKQRMSWWQDARFGMFIHWGLYAMPARHEWVRNAERISNENYQKYFDLFNPDEFDPKKWAKQAKAAGMKYAVLTTKHHEGFCLFDSKYTDYKAPNAAAKRDLIREYVDAFRAEGIKIGFYYSLLDWHHPDYTIDRCHPLRLDDKAPESEWEAINKGRDMAKYRQYLFNQVTELMSNYGKIDILWMDFSFPDQKHGKGKDDWNSEALIKQVRKLQPGIIVDNRLNLESYADGEDFETPEQVDPKELVKFRGKVWETCQTFSGSWGYYRDENTWKNDKQLLDLLITAVANGGNLILNVGPTARGEFDYRATLALDSLSLWMHGNSKAIYNCSYAPDRFKVPEGTRLTYNAAAKRLYVHLFSYPEGNITLPGYGGKIKYAQFLHDASELQTPDKKVISMAGSGSDIILVLPKDKPPVDVPVIELILQ